MHGIIGLIIEIIAGIIGGNAAGAAAKNASLGTAGNSIAGAIGGVSRRQGGRKRQQLRVVRCAVRWRSAALPTPRPRTKAGSSGDGSLMPDAAHAPWIGDSAPAQVSPG